MKRYIHSLNVLFGRDLREAIAPVGLVLGILLALEISAGLTPWARDPEVARTLGEFIGVLLTAALAIAFRRQCGDVRKERLRHLFTLPITAAQVLVSKMAVCCLLSTVVLLMVNGLWFLSRVPENAAYTVGYVLQATVNMCLVVLLFWGTLAVASVFRTWFMFILIAGALFLARDVPEPYHPMALALPPEPGDQPLPFARGIALALIIVLFITVERLLTLRPVE